MGVTMTEHSVVSLPERFWQSPEWRGRRRWQQQYNVAAWVRCHSVAGKVALNVFWEDDQGEHRAEVDATFMDRHGSTLLSGMVTISVTGTVKHAEIRLVACDTHAGFTVEELFFQQKGKQPAREDKLISNF